MGAGPIAESGWGDRCRWLSERRRSSVSAELKRRLDVRSGLALVWRVRDELERRWGRGMWPGGAKGGCGREGLVVRA